MEAYKLIVVIAMVTIGFAGYHFSAASNGLRQTMQSWFAERGEQVWWPLSQKLCGFVWMGVLPALASVFLLTSAYPYYGLTLLKPWLTLSWVGTILLIVIPIVYLKARSARNESIYPQIRAQQWNPRLLLLNALGWGSHLLAYEFLFRGLFLFTCVPLIGPWPAIILTTAFYTIAHLPKGLPETLASIPFGIILGWIAIRTGSIWAPFLIHWIMSQANDWFSIHFHPEMKFQR